MIMGRVSQTAPVAPAALLVLGFIFHATGLRVNVTRSIPIGLYRVIDPPYRFLSRLSDGQAWEETDSGMSTPSGRAGATCPCLS
jgi:hypothetical protein